MDLKSGAPFWALRNGLMTAFAPLKQDIRCDVLIVGAGITGALIADRFSRAGLAVCVVDQREVAYGSTSASTALLQYEIDTELHALAERYGLADATLAYQSCVKAVYALHRLASSLRGLDAQPMQSLYLASHWYHRQRLLDEGALRQRQGLAVEVLKEDELRKRFGLSAPAALLSTDAAQSDPYQLTHALLRRVRRRGGGVHDHTRIAEFASHRRGVRATTAQGCRIEAGNLVMAAGYESARHLEQKLAKNRSSYAYITDALTGSLGPLDRVLIWESARPYLYLRSTGDRRVLVGGKDDRIDMALKRDAMVPAKSKALQAAASKWLPEVDLTPAFAWAGTFAETEDGLPFFGSHPQHGPRVLFAMAYGGNGITYSQIGAELLLATVRKDTPHSCASLFSFKRLERGR